MLIEFSVAFLYIFSSYNSTGFVCIRKAHSLSDSVSVLAVAESHSWSSGCSCKIYTLLLTDDVSDSSSVILTCQSYWVAIEVSSTSDNMTVDIVETECLISNSSILSDDHFCSTIWTLLNLIIWSSDVSRWKIISSSYSRRVHFRAFLSVNFFQFLTVFKMYITDSRVLTCERLSLLSVQTSVDIFSIAEFELQFYRYIIVCSISGHHFLSRSVKSSVECNLFIITQFRCSAFLFYWCCSVVIIFRTISLCSHQTVIFLNLYSSSLSIHSWWHFQSDLSLIARKALSCV